MAYRKNNNINAIKYFSPDKFIHFYGNVSHWISTKNNTNVFLYFFLINIMVSKEMCANKYQSYNDISL